MLGYMKKETIEDFAVIGGLIGVQFIYAGNSVFLSYLMSLGLDPFTLVIFNTFATFLIVSPIAVYFERNKWPTKFSFKLMIQLLVISFAGVTLFQSLFLQGIKLTSPAMATAMPNLAPGLIFVIAWVFRFEKVKISCTYSKVKIVGTLLCVIGALILSIMHSTSAQLPNHVSPSTEDFVFDQQKIIGCLYLIAAVFVLSSNCVLQAAILGDFPAPMSMVAITSLIGVVITAGLQLFQEHNLVNNFPLVSLRDLIGYSLLGGAISGTCVSFSGWAMKKKGPVLVSMFSPIATVCSVILSAMTIGECFSLGSIAGMFIMFTGLYFVLWAKGKEGYSYGNDLESEFDEEKPLLSS